MPHCLPRSTYGLQSRSRSCPLRARFFSVRLTAGSVVVAGHLMAGLLADRVRNHLLTLHAAVKIDQRRPACGVAHAVHQLAESRSADGSEVVPGMAQVVKMNVSQPGLA